MGIYGERGWTTHYKSSTNKEANNDSKEALAG